jgi:hypothetical protein
MKRKTLVCLFLCLTSCGGDATETQGIADVAEGDGTPIGDVSTSDANDAEQSADPRESDAVEDQPEDVPEAELAGDSTEDAQAADSTEDSATEDPVGLDAPTDPPASDVRREPDVVSDSVTDASDIGHDPDANDTRHDPDAADTGHDPSIVDGREAGTGEDLSSLPTRRILVTLPTSANIVSLIETVEDEPIETVIEYLDRRCTKHFGDEYRVMMVFGGERVASASPNQGDDQVNWVLQPFTRYINTNGELIWETDDVPLLGVRDGEAVDLVNTIGITNGVRTGMNEDWTTHPDSCEGWSTNSSDLDKQPIGNSGYTHRSFLFIIMNHCGFSRFHYCVEQ